MIELASVIRELRVELQKSVRAGTETVRTARGPSLVFEAGPVELEATVAVEREGGAEGKVRFWIMELGADARMTHASTQRIKLTLVPQMSTTRAAPLVGHEGREDRG